MEFLDEVKTNLTDAQYMKGIEIAKKQNENENEIGFYKITYRRPEINLDPDDENKHFLHFKKTVSILKLKSTDAKKIEEEGILHTFDFEDENQHWFDEEYIGDETIVIASAVVLSIEKL